ncbi:hypothetical protein EV702DRAFT_971105, partial [Suillus placidus]
LRDHFETNGPHGQHLCLVLPVLSEGFRCWLNALKVARPAIVAQVVEALVLLHAANIIHTGRHRSYADETYPCPFY